MLLALILGQKFGCLILEPSRFIELGLDAIGTLIQ
jgi:hypothetical protein